MKKNKEFTKEEIMADLVFMLEQSYIIEHMQDYNKICEIRRKYGVSL